jgi:hypothetical protein
MEMAVYNHKKPQIVMTNRVPRETTIYSGKPRNCLKHASLEFDLVLSRLSSKTVSRVRRERKAILLQQKWTVSGKSRR